MGGHRAGRSGRWPKDLDAARKRSEKAGWSWEMRGSGHWMVRNLQGDFVTAMNSTLYDGTLTKKILSKLRKAGCP